MLSAIVVVFLLALMLLIVANITLGVLHAHRHHLHTLPPLDICLPGKQTHRQFASLTHNIPSSPPASQQVMVIFRPQDGVLMGVAQPSSQPAFTLPSSWYSRRGTLVSLLFLLMILLMLFVQSGLADDTLQNLSNGFALLHNFSQSSFQTSAHLSVANASQNLVRISQLDPGQYNSTDEYNTWAYSACSTASMTEVFNSYGYHFRITDVLKVEAQIGEITPDLGLVEPAGIERTAAQFGFKTTWKTSWTLDQIIDIANHGNPVIAGFPPDRYDGGHLIVVTGGNSDYVYLADSSGWNRHSVPRWQFLQWWNGFGAVVTPR